MGQVKDQEISHLNEQLLSNKQDMSSMKDVISEKEREISNFEKRKEQEIFTLQYQLKESKLEMEREVEMLEQKLVAYQRSDIREVTHTAVQADYMAVAGGNTCGHTHLTSSSSSPSHRQPTWSRGDW